MLPQQLTGSGVTVYIHFTDGSFIKIPLKGEWKAGTTKTYKISNTNSNWEYVLTADSPKAAAYNEDHTDSYKVTSYRRASDGTLQPVKWHVVGYSTDNGKTWNNNLPQWFISLSKTEGNGGTDAESGTASLSKAEVIDLLNKRNRELREAPARGTPENPYDLSMHDVYGNPTLRNTANCYVISAPGFYQIPLVYGNAIKDGKDNPSAYTAGEIIEETDFDSANKMFASTAWDGGPAGEVLRDFIVGGIPPTREKKITDPWIFPFDWKYRVKGRVEWLDEKDLIHPIKQPWHSPFIYKIDASNRKMETYFVFEVKREKIRNGNLVFSVNANSGFSAWSWHLWFTTVDALKTITTTDERGHSYSFTAENIGTKYTKWEGTDYSTPRSIKVKVEQDIANNNIKKEAIITIIQNPHVLSSEGYSTLYQWGRKDPFPATKLTPLTSPEFISGDLGLHIISTIINPAQYYWPYPGIQSLGGVLKMGEHRYYNLWSANSGRLAPNYDPVQKTIYDPCPVGFKVPPSRAFDFVGISNNIKYDKQLMEKNNGFYFWTNKDKNATIYFPKTEFSYWKLASNVLGVTQTAFPTYYWTAGAAPVNAAYCLGMGKSDGPSQDCFSNTIAFRYEGGYVRPVVDR